MFWNVTATAADALRFETGVEVSLAGRVVGFRRQGGIAFGHIVDRESKIQFCLQKRLFVDNPERFREWSDQIHLGCIIGISGETWNSSTGERTILVKDFKLLNRALLSFPDKLNGLADPEVKLRKRYLDCALDPEVKNIFRVRSKVISSLRNFMADHEFMEIETPVLSAQASGAQAKPFTTHHNALGADLFLRIAPETYLKRAVAAGFDRVFEIGKNFRNEGIDPSHLQEFTSVEWYGGYMHAIDNMFLFRKFLSCLFNDLGMENPWANAQVMTYREVFSKFTNGTNPDDLSSKMADIAFKTEVRPNLKGAWFITDYPAHMSPMAARKTGDEKTADQWQFIVDGWEVVKCYTELTDAVLQRQLLEEQALAKAGGDEEAMALEEDFLECMEHGMPPMSGLGMGIDRLVCLITGQSTLRDVVLFPTLLRKNG